MMSAVISFYIASQLTQSIYVSYRFQDSLCTCHSQRFGPLWRLCTAPEFTIFRPLMWSLPWLFTCTPTRITCCPCGCTWPHLSGSDTRVTSNQYLKLVDMSYICWYVLYFISLLLSMSFVIVCNFLIWLIALTHCVYLIHTRKDGYYLHIDIQYNKPAIKLLKVL